MISAALLGLAAGWLAAPGINKTQGVRILDVAVLGPVLTIWALKPRLSRQERGMLAFIGGATASYNLRNYLKYRTQESPGLTAPGAP